MTQRVFVFGGCLVDPTYERDTKDGVVYVSGLSWPLKPVDGSSLASSTERFVQGAFAGWSSEEGRYTRLVLGDPNRDVVLHEYAIARDPTPESVERRLGALHACDQVRMRCPSNRSADWLDGWRDVWIQRRATRTKENAA